MSAEYVPATISVSTDANNNVLLTIWTDMVRDEAVRVVLTPERGATLLRDLANQATYALTMSALSIARGDCQTCLNVRMVKTTGTGGRESNDHCPDCQTSTREGFPLRPQIGGGLA